MRARVFSDLHLEFSVFDPPKVEADVVVLAGDIGVGAKGVKWAARTFPDMPVIYVAGNHEYYGSSIEAVSAELASGKWPNVHVLENTSVVIGGVRFLGCTLWTDYELFGLDRRDEAMAASAQCLSDHRTISIRGADGKRKFLPSDALEMHRRSRQWLAEQLAISHDGPTVVVTHHAPHRNSVDPKYADDLVTAAYVSDLEPLVEKADLWVHGHTHCSQDYHIGGARVVCNPRGYRLSGGNAENRAFLPVAIVPIKR